MVRPLGAGAGSQGKQRGPEQGWGVEEQECLLPRPAGGPSPTLLTGREAGQGASGQWAGVQAHGRHVEETK